MSPRPAPLPPGPSPPPRIRIERVAPALDCGRVPVKRCVGDRVTVAADIFRDGHEVIRAAVQYRAPRKRSWREAPMAAVDAHHDGVRWEGAFPVDELGTAAFRIVAWVDRLTSWLHELERKVQAGQTELDGERAEGAALLLAEVGGASARDAQRLRALAAALAPGASLDPLLEPAAAELLARCGARHEETRSPSLEIQVDPLRARFGSWYELFPRSWGGLRGVQDELPRLAELGFDVLYLPPIHPIGVTNRKGRDNALVAGPGDPGSPWAIGAAGGGHTAVHPDLGTIADFDALVGAARGHGIDIALDLAIQCSADHPWLTEHPEWFHRRPDGTLKYAENPPKRYQDIYNLNFDGPGWRDLWSALRDVVRFWMGHGVRVFRVDNPHTKPLAFWEWLLADVRGSDPDVVFLSEAFTRRAVMRALAQAGFHQSYTYFTWKSSRWDLSRELETLLADGDAFRPNFFVNTPDILTAELQHGGPPAFALRAVLAATLSPSWGLYSGFESFENEPVREGSEEYRHSEKYELRDRSLDGPLLPLIGRLNAIRREHPALQRFDGLRLLETHNDALMAYARGVGTETILTVVNLDPHGPQEGLVTVPYELGVPPVFEVTDLLEDTTHTWRMGGNYVRLDPAERPAHVLRVEARA
ncbi:MAG TPA: alpha-1,4-glucan--maltose-1-phosphate maltosyltransferase [Solirubrobacteraceae bacterium]|nr:alpha-1,4-glucan--maltose-1-phosphate maltosyltransferase [Solirubrobacteraceae bacterium]